MTHGKCCAMKQHGKDTYTQCSRKGKHTVSVLGPDGSTIEKYVCGQHLKTINWDRDNGGQWGLRIRVKEEKVSDKGFHGFLGEPPTTDKYLVKTTKNDLVVGDTLKSGVEHTIMDFHHHCTSSDGTTWFFYVIRWKAPHQDPIQEQLDSLPQLIADDSDESSNESHVPADSELPNATHQEIAEMLGNQQRKRR